MPPPASPVLLQLFGSPTKSAAAMSAAKQLLTGEGAAVAPASASPSRYHVAAGVASTAVLQGEWHALHSDGHDRAAGRCGNTVL